MALGGLASVGANGRGDDGNIYFGNPIHTYSLKQGIADGFLAPYRVHRVVTDVDALGWRPTPGLAALYATAAAVAAIGLFQSLWPNAKGKT